MSKENEIDLTNIKVTNAIASVVNSAFETGLNPAWFEVERLNADGFLDAAFADGGLETPSKKPARLDWSLKVRLNDDGHEGEWRVITPKSCVESWEKMANDPSLKFLSSKADAYLRYLKALSRNDADKAEHILFNDYEPDGVHDDALAQYAVEDDVIFG